MVPAQSHKLPDAGSNPAPATDYVSINREDMPKNDKIIGNDIAIVNQILPFKEKWAYDLYLNGCANNWMPTEISMAKDIEQWNGKLSENEKTIVRRCLGFFAGSESLVANNLLINIFKWVSSAECRQYIARQQFEECYSEDTEVLTPKGWKLFSDLDDNDKIIQYNSDGTLDFVNFSNKVCYYYDGKMFRFYDGKKTDLLVTPNHRMVAISEKDRLFTKAAREISYLHNRMVVAGIKKGNKHSLTDWERFKIAFQADGSFPSKVDGVNRDGSRNGGFKHVVFNLKKQRKITRLESIISKLKLRFTKKGPDGRGRFTFIVWVPTNSDISKKFDWVDLEEVSSEWCKEFVDELKNWDGYKYRQTSCGYDSTIEFNSTMAQIIGIFANYKTNYGVHIDNRKKTYKDLHRITFTLNRNNVCRGVIKKEEVDYKGKVYCVSVPSGMLVVRRNRKVSVSGNSLHNLTIVYICEALNLDPEELYEAYSRIPAIKAKDDFLLGIIKDTNDKNFDISTKQGKYDLLCNIVAFYIICEGIMFYAGFAALLSFGRRNLLPGIVEQIAYSYRDEAVHLTFGVALLKRIKEQFVEIWGKDFDDTIVGWIREAVQLESQYAEEVFPDGIMGLNKENFVQYAKFLGNLRAEQLDLPRPFEDIKNPFPWMGETIETGKMKNFFESRVTDYQKGGIVDDF